MSEEQESALELELRDTKMSVTSNITPNEMRNAEFNSALRGFNREEVDEFLQEAALSLENALTETLELRAEHEKLQKKYDKLEGMEDALKSALLEAQNTADTIRAKGQRDAELIIERAHGKQVLIVEQGQERITKLHENIAELDKIRLEYQAKIRETISSHLKVVEEISFSAELPEPTEPTEPTETSELAEIDPAEIESTEIEEVSLFESPSSENKNSERSAVTETVEKNVTEVAAGPESPVNSGTNDSLHSDFKALNDTDPEIDTGAAGEHDEVSASPAETHSTAEAIACAVAQKVSSESSSDDTLYKKLAADSNESGSDPESEPKPADSRTMLQSGSDGIVVFGRKEDREKAVVENARILSDLDSVVDKFAEELREIDSK